MQTRLFNLFIKYLKNLNFDYIQNKILSRDDELKTHERFLDLKNQHPIFEITQTIFNIIDKHPEHENKIKDIYLSYLQKSQFSLSTPYYYNRHITNSIDIFGYINYILLNQTTENNRHILDTFNNWLVESGLNYNYEFDLPKPFIISMMDRQSYVERRDVSFDNFNSLKDFYFSNFDFSDINKNSILIARIINNFMSSYFDNNQFSYSILKKFLTNDQISYDKEVIREGIKKELHKKRQISAIKPKMADILLEFDLDYIIENSEKIYLYPYFYNKKAPSQENYIKYKDKKGGFFANKSVYFENINQFILKSLNIHSTKDYPEKYKNGIQIQAYENFYDLEDSCEIKLITIDKKTLNKKIDFIDKHNLLVNHTSLIDSLNSKIEEIKNINNLYSEDLFHDNFKVFIDYHIKNIDYSKKEQPLLETIHIINSLQKHKPLIDFINEKAKELSFTNEHFYKNINYNEIKNLLYPEKDQYLPHIDLEKLLSVNIRKNINKTEGDFVYNGNSFYASLFNKQGKYTSGMSEKRLDILKKIESINKIDNPYCIADGQKILRSEHLTNIITEQRLSDLRHISFLLKEIKNEKAKGVTFEEHSKNTALVFLCFQRPFPYKMTIDCISQIREELYQNDTDFLQNLCFSFTLDKDKHQTVFAKKYEINNNDEIYKMIIQKIPNVQDNTLLEDIKNIVLTKFQGSNEEKNNFQLTVNTLIERNTISSMLEGQTITIPLDKKERRRM